MVTKGWRSSKKISEYLTPEEIHALINSVPRERDKLLLRVLWETAARVSEATNLIPDNVDPQNNYIILVNLKQNKRKPIGKDEEGKPIFPPKKSPPLKRIYLSSESTLCKDLLQYCDENQIYGQDFVFGGIRNPSKPLSPVYVWRLLSDPKYGMSTKLHIRRLKKNKRGVEENRAAWPHIFRHSQAMFLLEKTGRFEVVKEQLGHSSILTTEIYAGLTDQERKRIVGGIKDGSEKD